jgi:hypothetical protein
VDENGKQLLEADLEEMLQITLKQGESLKQAGGARGASHPFSAAQAPQVDSKRPIGTSRTPRVVRWFEG